MPTAHEISIEFGLKILGDPKREANYPASLNNQSNNSLAWIKNKKYIDKVSKGIILVSSSISPDENLHITYLLTDDSPKIVFSKILSHYFEKSVDYYMKNCIEQHRENNKIKIGDNVFIGQNVTIGKGTVIFPNSLIAANTVIGENCIIKSNSSIGSEGLGFEFEESTNSLVKFPQLGNVIVSDNVEIGPNSTIRRAALASTIVGKNTKIGALCNVGHNCIIGENCILTCNVVTSGSSIVGNRCFLGVSSSIRQGVKIEDDVTIGQGTVVLNNISSGETWIGNPATRLNK